MRPTKIVAVLTLALGLSSVAGADPFHGQQGSAPPEEAFAACKGKSDGASCSLVVQSQRVDGTCTSGEGKRPFCRPSHLPPPPRKE